MTITNGIVNDTPWMDINEVLSRGRVCISNRMVECSYTNAEI